MPLTLRPNSFHTETRSDYEVRENGKKIGRIYSSAGSRGEQWIWALDGIGKEIAESLADAKVKLHAKLKVIQAGQAAN